MDKSIAREVGMPKWEAKSEVSGFIWKVETAPGQRVAKGDTLVIIESMKMEIPVVAESDGTVVSIPVEEGAAVNEGNTVAILEV
ncbi:MAG: biotin/lipoyl-binding carrier protein [Bradyrhizobium sp.]|nr:biotin/lipoyl-binding carrier protein [Bradyrhizobium sp.]